MSSPKQHRFADLGLHPGVLNVLESVGYEQPSPIQAETIPLLLEGRDVLGTAQTGTGKTAAFALPILSRLELSRGQPQSLVLTPTRELAIQVAEAFQRYAAFLNGFHVLPIYGGSDMRAQLRQLQRRPHVIVGTPGRVMDHLRRGSLDISQIRTLVLDEADEMLRMGFIEDVEWILEHTPKGRQVALFSATMPGPIRKVSERYLHQPARVQIEAATTTASEIDQHFWLIRGFHKLDALTRILEVEDFDAMLIFVRTKTATAELSEKLEARGYNSSALNGDMNQALRERTIEKLKGGTIDIVVATDVAARGIDVERISHVVNYDIPYDSEAYVHRVGRTGRAGRSGKAILFVAPRERHLLRSIERATRQPITEMALPTGREVADRRIMQFREQLKDTLEDQDLSFFQGLVEKLSQDLDVPVSGLAAAMIQMLQRDRPLQVKDRPIPPPERERPRDKSRKEGKPGGGVPYRLEVGREHGVQPGDIVGAIANEAGLDSRHIGRIRLFDTFSIVELPDGMPKDIFEQLKKVRVRNQPLKISLDRGPGGRKAGKSGKGKPAGRPPRRD